MATYTNADVCAKLAGAAARVQARVVVVRLAIAHARPFTDTVAVAATCSRAPVSCSSTGLPTATCVRTHSQIRRTTCLGPRRRRTMDGVTLLTVGLAT
jgi:hypothetical protein